MNHTSMKTSIPFTFSTQRATDIDTELSDLELLAGKLGLKTIAGRTFLRIALENTILMDKKQQDYGSGNISDFGITGVIVRMNDKWRRITNLIKTGRRRRALNESIKDSFVDMSNYAIIALMLENKEWPSE